MTFIVTTLRKKATRERWENDTGFVTLGPQDGHNRSHKLFEDIIRYKQNFPTVVKLSVAFERQGHSPVKLLETQCAVA
jgi:hypothetical protein